MAAFTPANEGSYPAYINVSREENGMVTIHVRSPRKTDGGCGETAAITMFCEEWDGLLEDLKNGRPD
jgi:hypothetical protein